MANGTQDRLMTAKRQAEDNFNEPEASESPLDKMQEDNDKPDK